MDTISRAFFSKGKKANNTNKSLASMFDTPDAPVVLPSTVVSIAPPTQDKKKEKKDKKKEKDEEEEDSEDSSTGYESDSEDEGEEQQQGGDEEDMGSSEEEAEMKKKEDEQKEKLKKQKEKKPMKDRATEGSRTVGLRNMPSSKTKKFMSKLFSVYGTVESIRFVPNGDCFVVMDSAGAAKKATKAINGFEFKGKKLVARLISKLEQQAAEKAKKKAKRNKIAAEAEETTTTTTTTSTKSPSKSPKKSLSNNKSPSKPKTGKPLPSQPSLSTNKKGKLPTPSKDSPAKSFKSPTTKTTPTSKTPKTPTSKTPKTPITPKSIGSSFGTLTKKMIGTLKRKDRHPETETDKSATKDASTVQMELESTSPPAKKRRYVKVVNKSTPKKKV